ncbi:MAG: 16S rRNA (cytidine(1402)-2'-O)-methyltransferase [Candidatus Blackburnbacteria bacterium RIFCSPHIGHO2_12_FULL_41_13b]|uniref:Ribosomal RNA small subunit methyltransferase I n=1 Tax=Candidatus Blackburnbacteria bacterium RIFCSPHIGHO2_12_FULL_41_13b TaxID=1797517 RepID=A0A1G1V4V2_9BACT|nr:MAG: 16S rRNA (cytidine(1402)-2'-O)-methyltransferase [Candidatus Blackburnbacteria bacterium RIFCSPHIGHO2_12_FULL_41_13b]
MNNTSGKLFIISTPIGNFEDITLRALSTLRDADVILAEDTRTTANLLKHYNIPRKEIISFFEGNEEKRHPEILNLLITGKNVALVSESGTPLVSDPGYKLIRELVSNGIKIETIPGPTALVAALVVSGLPTNSFLFMGFLPKKSGKAKTILENTKSALSALSQCKSVILYESPHRIVKTLQLVKDVFGEIDVVVARELTKIHEEVRREKVSQAIEYFTTTKPRGEFVLLFSIENYTSALPVISLG